MILTPGEGGGEGRKGKRRGGDGEGGEGRGGVEGEGIEGRGGDQGGREGVEGSGRERVEIINASYLPSIHVHVCACVIMCTGNELQYALKLL